jgi:hypothetical protein
MQYSIIALVLLTIINSIHCIFFDLQNPNERCYIEELFSDSTIMIKYKLFTPEKGGERYITQTLNEVHIRVYDEEGNTMHAHTVKSYKDKLTFHTTKESYYRVCVEAIGGTYDSRSKIYFRLKVTGDNSPHQPDISKAIKDSDVEGLHGELRKLIKKGDKVIRYQENELDGEDKIARLQMSDSRLYYAMTLFQIIVIGLVCLYNIYNFIQIIKK